MKIETKKITLIATLAAIYAVGSYIPGFPMAFVPGSSIDITRSLEMGYGLILGPIFGPLAAFLGSIVGKIITGKWGGLYFTPVALVSAFMASALSRRYILNVRGWMIAAAMLLVLIAGWYGTMTGRTAALYPILHIIGLGLILILRGKIADYFQSEEKGKLTMGVALCSFISTMAGHMLGSLITMFLFKLTPFQFMILIPVYTTERLFITAISTVFAASLILIMRDVFPELMEGN
ncbi:hypothetical protein AC482_01540 [miscellaneous Crenarchaeota group-15 archaeon DG-45]|uniref:ECF transporter S component n=1 Tax=miscellaneous Crenarchaeota group-15 archaeon DG-45 TaxID=1685127 RepID=A0A0M0BS02_9ARCH|nr:MAG: hypothetical protein AC482_01540 [miscellaneous Crenarchaeota group-15 archaeon DG-45]